jgi:hypothetical protein
MPIWGNANKEVEVERGERTPVQVEERRVEGKAQGHDLPKIQARSSAVILTLFVASFISFLIAMGPALFWLTTSVFGLTTLIWCLRQARQWEFQDETGNWYSPSVPALAVGVFATLLLGLVAWSVQRVLGYFTPEIEWSGFVARAVEFLTHVKAHIWGSFLAFVFFFAFFLHLEPAFLQELLYRSPFFEQYVFEALGDLIKYHGKRPRPKRQPMRIYDRGKRVMPGGNGRTAAEEWTQEIVGGDDERREELGLMEFLVRGQRWLDKDGVPIRYSRA